MKCAALWLLMGVVGVSAAAAENLVANPDFSLLDGEGFPKDWTVITKGEARAVRVKGPSGAETTALEFSPAGGAIRIQQALAAGRSYRVRFQAKAAAAEGVAVYIATRNWDKDARTAVKGSHDWRSYEFTASFAEPAAHNLILTAKNGRGSVWFTNFSVERTDAAERAGTSASASSAAGTRRSGDAQSAAAASPAAPAKARLPGFRLEPLTPIPWPESSIDSRLARWIDRTPLGLHLVELRPGDAGVGFQWSGHAVAVRADGKGWRVLADPPGADAGIVLPAGPLIVAGHASGVIVRAGDAVAARVDGGYSAAEMALLAPTGAATPAVRALALYPEALRYVYLLEAERALGESTRAFEANLPVLEEYWRGAPANALGNWRKHIQMLDAAIADAKRATRTAGEGWVEMLLDDPMLRDRYNYLVSNIAQFRFATGYLGAYYSREWFTRLGGSPPYAAVAELQAKVDRLIGRARRLTGATFREGASDGRRLSAVWADNLTMVPRAAGLPWRVSGSGSVLLARGEGEGAQLVLSTGPEAAAGCSISVEGDWPPGLRVTPHVVDYVRLSESYMSDLPPSPGGDAAWPDVLASLADRDGFSIAPWSNQPIWFTVSAASETPPGEYAANVTVSLDGRRALQTSLAIQVADVDIGAYKLSNIAGMRFDGIRRFYGPENEPRNRRRLMETLLDYRLNPLDLYAATPPLEDVAWAVERGMTSVMLGYHSALAPPRPEMADHVRLFGSADGRTFVPVKASAKLVKRGEEAASDWDLVITPEEPTGRFAWLKAHNAQTHDWHTQWAYSFFVMELRQKPVILIRRDGGLARPEDVRVRMGDVRPESQDGGTAFEGRSFPFDSLRDAAHHGSVVFPNAEGGELAAIRLENRNMESRVKGLTERHAALRRIVGPDFTIYAYSNDETPAHMNRQQLASLRLVKTLFPDVRTISTANEPAAAPELWDSLDIHSPDNGKFLPREAAAARKAHGTEFWSYVGGGAWYPFGNFERVDQPFALSRAFFWPFLVYDLTGFLYWDIHMWRYNMERYNPGLPRAWPDLWDMWNTSHGEYKNGMGAIFYPGPDGAVYPSIRAELIRDGIEDWALFQAARAAAAARGGADAEERLEMPRRRLVRSMSVYAQDPDEIAAARRAVFDLLAEWGAAAARQGP